LFIVTIQFRGIKSHTFESREFKNSRQKSSRVYRSFSRTSLPSRGVQFIPWRVLIFNNDLFHLNYCSWRN